MDSFKIKAHRAGLESDEKLAIFFDVSVRTVKNWKKNNKPPHAVFLCLNFMIGDLSHLGKNWKGFRLTDDCIESPEGDFIYHYEVRSLRYIYQVAEIQRFKLCRQLENNKKLVHKSQNRNRPGLFIVK